MNQQSVPSTGIHICIMDKVVDEEDSMSQLRNDVEVQLIVLSLL